MPLAKSLAVSLIGLNATSIDVEADISSQLPNFILVGLPDASLSEATARVRAAIVNSGLPWPARRITVNLSPASVPKHGSAFDLAIAIAVLAAGGTIKQEALISTVLIGELTLDGSVKAVQGVLPMVRAARDLGSNTVMVSRESFAEAALIAGIKVVAVEKLTEAVQWFSGSAREGGSNLSPAAPIAEPLTAVDDLLGHRTAEPLTSATQRHAASRPERDEPTPSFLEPDISDVLGQELAVNALIVAAAGGHHMLMVGSPGAGKTMLAERLPGLLPDLSVEEALETAAVASIAGRSVFGKRSGSLDLRPKFEAPHHSASMSAMVGGGLRLPRPGAISMAHNGVLFLDEAPEFQTPVLDALRQPLESAEIRLHRTAGTAVFPARFQLLLAANPCPCGQAFSRQGCQCPPMAKARYSQKLSGPLLDRIDIRIIVQPVDALSQKLMGEQQKVGKTQTTAAARKTVEAARESALERLRGTPWQTNAQVSTSYLRGKLRLSSLSTHTLDLALNRGRISMRGYDRCLRLAWTLADIAGHVTPTAEDVSQAFLLRGPDNPLVSR